jgi:transposase
MQAQDLLLFQAALGLTAPWQVTSVEFDRETKRLDLRIDFPRGATFCCPECDRAGLKARDTEEKAWRHLDFFQHQAYLTARVPRVECPEHKVRLVALPWARERSGFTLLFEALVMAMVREMPVKAVAGLVGEYDKRIWRIVHHYVDLAVDAQDLEGVDRVGIDETSSRRGHEYVSVFADLDERRGVFVVEDRDHETVSAFSGSLGIDVVRFSGFRPRDRVTGRPGRHSRRLRQPARTVHRARPNEPRFIGTSSDAISLVAGCSEPSRTPLRGSLRSALRPVP